LFFGHNLPTTNARRPTKKTKKLHLELFSHSPMTLSKNPLTPSTHHIISKEVHNPKVPRFFLIKPWRLTDSLEGLISLLAPSVGKL